MSTGPRDDAANRPRDPATPRPRDGSQDDIAAILRNVRRIEIRTRKLVSSLTAGRFRSAFKGQGMEFDEVREYAPGDDVRTIDWNVTARAGRPHVKTFREERELTVWLLVDGSGSMRFGAIPGLSPRAKLALAAEAAAVIGVTAFRNHDRLGLVRFTDRTDLHLAPRKGRGHCLRVVREVLAAPAASGATALDHALDELARVAPRRGVVFLLSDFLHADGEAAGRFTRALARAARRHDVVGLRVTDPGEEALPAGSTPLALTDPESGRTAVLANGRAARARYAQAWTVQRSLVEGCFRGTGCDLVDLRTEQGAFTALARYFRGRTSVAGARGRGVAGS